MQFHVLTVGDKFGSIEKPSTYFIEIATNTMVYANKFSEYENSDFIMSKYSETFSNEYKKNIKSEPSETFYTSSNVNF